MIEIQRQLMMEVWQLPKRVYSANFYRWVLKKQYCELCVLHIQSVKHKKYYFLIYNLPRTKIFGPNMLFQCASSDYVDYIAHFFYFFYAYMQLISFWIIILASTRNTSLDILLDVLNLEKFSINQVRKDHTLMYLRMWFIVFLFHT